MSPTLKGRASERGSALVLALFMIVILTVLGLGLVLRTRVTMSVAASERPITKNFYAADGAVQTAFARLQLRNPCPFTFNMKDVRNPADQGGYPLTVNVEQSLLVSSQRAVGSEAGGGLAGGGTSLVLLDYRLRTNSFEQVTQTRRAVEAEVIVGPTVAGIEPPCE